MSGKSAVPGTSDDPKAPSPSPRWRTVELSREVAGRDGARGIELPAAPRGRPYTVTFTLPEARPAWVSVLGDGADGVFAEGARRDNRFDRREHGADLVFTRAVRTIELTVSEGAPEGLVLAGPFGSVRDEPGEQGDPAKKPGEEGAPSKKPRDKAVEAMKPGVKSGHPNLDAPRVAPPAQTSRRASACTPSAGFTNCTLLSYTGADQTFSVPTGVSSLNVQLWGAGGGGDNAAYYTGQVGGAGGGYTTGTLAVTPGQSFTVMAGQGGNVNSTATTYGGGGAGGASPLTPGAVGASGGGMSALWSGASFSTPLLIAGGGGGASPGADTQNPKPGGGGGVSGGGDGNRNTSGQGGTQTAGGTAGAYGSQCGATSNTAGRQWFGGNGYNTLPTRGGEGGGGGGGGYFGGGGGACQPSAPTLNPNGPGGGGSGYIGGAGITGVSTANGSSPTANNQGGAAAGTGSAQYPAGVGVGGSDSRSGGNGAVVIQWVTQTKLSVTKTASPNPYVPGNPVTYTITVANAGPAPATNARITDTIPAGLTGTTWTCTASNGSSCGASSGTGNTLNTTATLAANGTATYTVTGTTSPSATAALTNTATVTPPTGVNDTTCGASCSATATTPAAPRADLAATKTASTANVSPGQTYTYTLTGTNNGPSTATNVRMTDTLPNNVTFQSGSGCTASGQSVTCGPVASLAPGATQSWTITVKLASSYKGTGSDIGNTATVTSDTTDPNSANNTATSGPPPIVAQSDYDVTPSGPGGTVAPGRTTTIPVVVKNNGPADAAGNVTVTVTLPTGVTASGTQPSGCTANSAGTVVTCTVASLDAGSSLNLPVSVLVSPSAAPNSTLTQTGGIVVSGPNDNVTSNNTADVVVRTTGGVSDLAVTKTASPTSVNYGENTVFTVTVTNNGPSDAANVQVSDQLPSGLTYVSDDSNGAYSGGVWRPGTVGAGKSVTLRITARVSGTTAQTNTVTRATSDSTDPTPCSGNCASATVTPIAADVATTKTATGTPIAPGETFQYDIKVTNNGPSAAAAVAVTDTLPSQLTFVSSASGCTAAGQNVTCPQIASLANGASQTFTITVRLASTYTGNGSDVANTATSTSTTPDQTPGNNTSPPASPQVTAVKTGLTVSKTGSSTSYQPGETFSYTVTVRNAGPSTALPTVTDTLPAGFAGFGWNCAATNGSSCGAGSGSGNISDRPSVAPGGTITYTISGTVPASTSGNQTNSATVRPGSGSTDAGCSPSCTSSVVTNGPSVQVSKTSAPAPAKAGQTVTYTITLKNSGTGDASSFTYTDDLSDVVDDASFVAGSITSTPAGGTGSYDSGAKKLTWTGAVAAGATVRVTYQVTVGNPPGGNQALKNVVTAPGTNCAAGSTDSACSDDNGGGIPRLAISKASDAGGTVHPGQKVTYTVTVRNPGTATYRGAQWSDDLTDVLDDATYGGDATASAGSMSYVAPKLSWSGNLAAGASATITYSVTVGSPDAGNNRLVNQVTSSTDADCSACTTTNGVAGLKISKSVSSAHPKPGSKVTYTVTATNTGSVTYTGASWSDDLTGVLDDAAYGGDASASSGTVSYAAPVVRWTGDLAAGATATVTYSVTVDNPDAGDRKLTNSVTGPAGSTCDPCTTTSSVPQLKLTKTSSPANPAAGQTVTYTVVAENTGAAVYTGATWSDDLSDLIDDGTYAGDAAASSGEVSYAAPVVRWTGDLDPGDKATTTYSVKLANPLSGNKRLVNKVVSTTDTNCASGSTSSACGDQTPVTVRELTMKKAASNTAPKPGDTITYTVTVENTGTAAYPGATWSDTLVNVLDDGTYNGDASASVGSVNYSAPKLTWTGDLAVGATATVTYTVTLADPDEGDQVIRNTLVSTSDGSNCQADSTDPACTAGPYGIPSLILSKAVSPEHPLPGDTLTYTIKLVNSGATDYPGASFSDDLTGVLDEGTWANRTTASTGTVGYTAPVVRWTGTVPAGTTQTVTYQLKLNDPRTGDGTMVNTVVGPAGSNCKQGSTDNRCSSDVGGLPELHITKTQSPANPVAGQRVTYTVAVENTGNAAYNGATWSDDLSAVLDDAVYGNDASASAGSVSYAAPVVKWSGDLAAGASATVTYSVSVNAPVTGDQKLTNSVAGPQGSNCSTSLTDDDCSASSGIGVLKIAKSYSPQVATPGSVITYTVSVENTGTGTYLGASGYDDLTGVLDDAVYNDDASTDGGSIKYEAPKLTWRGDLAAGEKATVTYSVTVNDPDTGDKKLANAVTGPAGSNCAAGSVDPACAPTPAGVPTLAISKTASSNRPTPGSKVTYTVTVSNTGTAAYTGASWSDDLTDVIDDATYGGDAAASSGVVSYAAPVVKWTGDLAAGASATITYSVTVKAPLAGNGKLANAVTGPAGSNCQSGKQSSECSTGEDPGDGIPQLTLTKTSSPANPVPGTTVTYTVVAKNTGTAVYSGATWSDDLSGVLDDATYGGDAAASSGVVSYAAPVVKWTGDLAAGASATTTYSATVNAPDTGDLALKNAVTGPNGTECTACSTSSGVGVLKLSKTYTPDTATPGSKLTYTVTVENTGTGTYPGASWTDDLTGVLDDATYGDDAAASAGSVNYAAPKLSWTGDLAAGASATTTYTVTVNDPDTGDKKLGNAVVGPKGSNCAAGSTDPACTPTPAGVPTLSITKTASENRPTPGSKVTYKVVVENTGTAAYRGASWSDDLTDVVDDATYGDDASASSGDVKYAAPKLSWTGDLAAGASATVTYSVTVKAPLSGNGKLANAVTGPAGSNCQAGSKAPECSTGDRTGDGIPQLTLNKTVSEANPKPGTTVTYTVVAKNTGTAVYTGATWSDDLTGVLDDAVYGNDATATAGSVSYASPVVKWTGDLAAGASATTTYSVTVDTPDTGDKKLVNSVTGPAGSVCQTCTTTSSVPQLKLTKTSSPSNPAAGQTVTYTVVAENTGAAAYTDATWSDDLSELIDDGTYADDASASSGDVKYAAPKLTWTGDLAAGASTTTTYSVKLANPLAGDKKLVNKVVSTTDTNCPSGTANSACGNQSPVLVRELTMKKTSSSTAPKPGDKVTYTVTVTNTGTAAYDGATWSDDLSGVLDDAAYGGDAAASTGSVNYSAPTLTWTGDLAAGASATTTYTITLDDPDTGDQTLKNTLVSTSPGANCGSGSTDSACTAGPYGIPSLTLTKTVSPGTPLPGDTITYTVTVQNTGTAAYTGATFTDDLSDVLDSATWLNTATATAGSVAYASPKLTWTGTVAAGATETVTYALKLNNPRTGNDTILNSVEGPAGSNCKKGSTDNRCSAAIDGLPELHLTKKSSPASPVAGGRTTYTVSVQNTGSAAYQGAVWSDDLSGVLDDAVYDNDAAASSGAVNYAAPKLTWTGDLAAGASATITYSVTVTYPVSGDGTLKNALTGPQGSNCEAGSTDADCSTSNSVGALRIAKTYSPQVALPGGKMTYTVTVENTGTGTYPDATFTDDLTGVLDDAVYGDASATTGSVTYAAPKLTWTGDLAAQAKATITYTVTLKDPDTGDQHLTNSVVGPPGSNCAVGSTDPACAPPPAGIPSLELAKTASTNRPTPGTTVSYTVTVTNTGTAAYAGASWSDDLTGVLDDAAYGDDAAASAGSVSYAAPVVKWSGDLAAGASVTVTYSVTVDNPLKGDGKLTNAVTGPAGSNCQAGKKDPACSTGDEPGDGIPQLKLKKTVSSGSAAPGSKVTYRITAQNTGTALYTGASWSDDLSALLSDAVYGDDAVAGEGSVSYAAPVLTWTGDVAVGETVTTTYSVTLNNPTTSTNPLKNTVTSTSDTNCPSGTANSDCSSTLGVPQFSLTKTASTNHPLPGQDVTYTVTVQNTGSVEYVGAVWSDDLTGVLDDAVYGDDANASSGKVSYGSPKLSWTGDVPVGGTVTVTYTVKVKSDPAQLGDGVLTNAITSASPGNNCSAAANSGCSTTSSPVPTLKFTKSRTTPVVLPGAKVEYKVTVENPTAADYPGASWSDDLSGVLDDAVYGGDAAASSGSVSYAEPVLKWSGDVPGGSTVTITYSVTVDVVDRGDGKLTNTVVSGVPGTNCPAGSTNAACSSGSGTSGVVPRLKIVKSVDASDVLPGDLLNFKVVVTNDSAADYPGATFTDRVVRGAALLNKRAVKAPSADSGTLTPGSGLAYTWVGDVAAGASVTVTYTYMANAVPTAGTRKVVNEVTDASANTSCYGNTADGTYPPGCGATVDTPQYEWGEAPDSYRTLAASGGPYHAIVPGLYLGKGSFPDIDGHPGSARLDEGGRGPRVLPAAYTGGTGYSTTVDLTNTTGTATLLAAWLDYDFNGRFDQGERILRTIPAGARSTVLDWADASFAKAGTTYLRLRLYGAQVPAGRSPDVPPGESLVRVGGHLRTVPAQRALPADPQPYGYGGAGQVEDFRVRASAGKLNVRITSDNAHPRPGDKVTYTVTVCSATGAPYAGATASASLAQVLKYATYNGDAAASNGTVRYGSSAVSWTGTAPGDCSHPVRITFSVTYGRAHVPPGTVVDVPVVGGPGASNCPAGSAAAECNASAVFRGHGQLPDTGGGRGVSPGWGVAAVVSVGLGFLLCLAMWMRRRRGWRAGR